MERHNCNKKHLIILTEYMILGILIISNLRWFFSKSIWYDEAYSLNLAKGNITDIINGTAADVHPPLYYLILKLGLVIGNNIGGGYKSYLYSQGGFIYTNYLGCIS